MVGERGTINRLTSGPRLHSGLEASFSNVDSVRELVAHVTCSATGTGRLGSLRRAIRELPRVGSLLTNYRDTLLGSVDNDVSPLRSIRSLVNHTVSRRPPLAIHRNKVVGSNCGRRISRLHSIVRSNTNIITTVRTHRHRRANVPGLGINCGHIFKCCVRIAGSCGSVIPRACVEGRALAGYRECVARRLGRLRNGVINTGSHSITLRCRIFYSIHRAVSHRARHVRGATGTLTILSALTDLTRTTTAGGCYYPRVSAGNIVSVGSNHRPIIRTVVGNTPFIPGSAILSASSGHYVVVANPGVTNGSACVHRVTLVIVVTRVNSFIPTHSTSVNVISTIFAEINTTSSLTANHSAFVIRVDRISSVLGGTARGDLVVLSRVNENASAFSNVDVTQTILRFIYGGGALNTGALFTARCRRLATVRNLLSNIGGCSVTIGGHNSSVAFLHEVIHNKTSRDFNVRITGLTNIPSSIIHETGIVLGRLRRGGVSVRFGTRSTILRRRRSVRCGFTTGNGGRVLRVLGTASIGALAPVRTVRALCSLGGGTRRLWIGTSTTWTLSGGGE